MLQPCPLPLGHLPAVQLSRWHGATSVALVWDGAGGRSWGAAVLTGSCAFVPLRWA